MTAVKEKSVKLELSQQKLNNANKKIEEEETAILNEVKIIMLFKNIKICKLLNKKKEKIRELKIKLDNMDINGIRERIEANNKMIIDSECN